MKLITTLSPRHKSRFVNAPSHEFDDGLFSFWTAHYGSADRDKKIVFRCRHDKIPLTRAKEKGIVGYDEILPASSEEINTWLYDHNHTDDGTMANAYRKKILSYF